MGKTKKKNVAGNKKVEAQRGLRKGVIKVVNKPVQQYITRNKALSRLSISLQDFRKLCILKGIYPRDPKNKKQGKDKTYYHIKDIRFLSHEPLLRKFLDLKTFLKKFKKVQNRMGGEKRTEDFEKKMPKYTLHHLVRERYPSFDAALQDLDDAMCMLALFAALPANQRRNIPAKDIQESIRLYQEFQLYCIKAKCLRRMFCSIKGYYWQASIQGVNITWVAPHQFAQDLPWEVDFTVMLTFLEFYRTLLKFVNFRLFSLAGFAYPPSRDAVADAKAGGVAALELVALEKENAGAVVSNNVEQVKVPTDFADTEEGKKMQAAAEANDKAARVFEGLKFFISREVPLAPLYFLLKCGAAVTGFSTEASPFPVSDAGITHVVVDRPPEHLKIIAGREYVQPQWVFDSFNCGVLLPIAPYAPGKAPPSHLSPFVDDHAEGYVPKQREILNALIQQRIGGMSTKVTTKDGQEVEVSDDEEEMEQQFQAELAAEAKGIWASDFAADHKDEATTAPGSESESEAMVDAQTAKKIAKAEARKAEELKRQEALLNAKPRRLYRAIKMGQAKKEEELSKLKEKRKAAKKDKAKA